MTRRGSPEERRWRRNRNLEPGSDGSVHGEQPVDPRGRLPREKPSGHRHKDPQPAKEHGSGKHDGTVADNPHGDATHDSTVAPAPHGNASHSPGMVENAVGVPSLRRETRASQPAPSNVAVGTRSVIEDEANTEEVAADTTGDGTADTWVAVVDGPHRDSANPHTGSAASPHGDAAHSRDYDTDFVNVGGDTMSGALDLDQGGTGLIRLQHTGDATRNWGLLSTRDDSGNRLEYFQFGPAESSPRHEFRGAVTLDSQLTMVDANMSGALTVDKGGIGFVRLQHTGDATRNWGLLSTRDDSGNRVEYMQFGPAEGTPRHELRNGRVDVIGGDLRMDHADITLDGGDVIANKSSHGGNIVAQGWIDATESVVASTYMRATNKMGVMTSGSPTNPTIRFDASSSLGIPHCGFYKNTDANGNHRVAVAGDDNAVAGFHPASLNRSVFPRSDNGADLGDTDAAWGTVHYYNLNNVSDPTLKTDIRTVDPQSAAERVRRTAQAAIGFRWTDGGQRTHLGFDADLIGQAHGDQSAAFVDPAVNGEEGVGSLDGSHTEPHKAIRPVELIPDLYAAVSQLLDRVDALEAA